MLNSKDGATVTSQDSSDLRPAVDAQMSAEEFGRWYWPVDLLKAFCEDLGLSSSGTKSDLRARVAYMLEHGQAPKPSRKPRKSGFNWSKETLDGATVITDTISFGPNVRGFFKDRIGQRFSCHSDFMDWVKANPGKTLEDAVDAWTVLEARKDDPDFRREIATCNNYLQYLRDARDAYPGMTLDEAKLCWDFKKVRPAQDGIVIFEQEDVARAKCQSNDRP